MAPRGPRSYLSFLLIQLLQRVLPGGVHRFFRRHLADDHRLERLL